LVSFHSLSSFFRYLKDVPRRAKNGFRENTQAPARRVGAAKK
jgi:hypothetical protein